MIQMRDDVAWVRFANDQLAPFDEHRLAMSIHRAAERIGNPDWWLAESVAAAVHVFVVKSRNDGIILSAEVAEIVAVVLSTLGYEKLSRAYGGSTNRVAIHLNKLTGQASAAFELEFYQQLDRALGAAANRQLLAIEVNGLRACVMQLRGTQRWTTGCRKLAEEIVEHVRERVARVRPPQAASLRLAVVE